MIRRLIIIPIKIILAVIDCFLNVSINVAAFVGSILLMVLIICIVHSIMICRWTNLFIAIAMSLGILLLLFLAVVVHETIKNICRRMS